MAAILFEEHPVSDHIMIQAFPAAKAKGEICVFGSLKGFSDYATEAGAEGSVDIGKLSAVFQAATADLTGDAAVAADVYMTSAGVLTTTATDNVLFGTIVSVGTDTFKIAVL